jgi:two-component system response regulator
MIEQTKAIKTLIVDDSKTDCMLLQLELQHIVSIKVIGFVDDGLAALAYLRGTEQFKDREMFPYPDLMLLDYRMPRCDGMEVLAYLEHQFYRPRVILWSDTIEQIDVPMALRFGADYVCKKPANLFELITIINRVEKTFTRPPVLDDEQIAAALSAVA